MKRARARDQKVLLELAKIPSHTLKSWIQRHFATVSDLATAELCRRRGR